VIAEKIKVETQRSDEEENTDQNNSESTSGEDNPGKGNGKSGDDDHESTSSPENEATLENEEDKTNSGKSGSENSQSTSRQKDFEVEGVVSSYNGSSISVDNRIIFIIPATELRGNPAPGSRVSIRGYVNEKGVLIAQRIDVKSSSEGGSGGGGSGSSGGSDDDDDPTKTPEPDETPDD